jgi:vacuolar-type H+-ATPase subunit E/Vma4
VGDPAVVSLEAFRDAVLADAHATAAARLAAANREAADRLADARHEAAQLTTRAADEGRRSADRTARGVLAAARREARGAVLRARRDALAALAARTVELLADERTGEDLARLREALAERARRQLGDGVVVQPSPDGGVVAVDGGRSVDYRLATIVAREMDALGVDVEEAWQ